MNSIYVIGLMLIITITLSVCPLPAKEYTEAGKEALDSVEGVKKRNL